MGDFDNTTSKPAEAPDGGKGAAASNEELPAPPSADDHETVPVRESEPAETLGELEPPAADPLSTSTPASSTPASLDWDDTNESDDDWADDGYVGTTIGDRYVIDTVIGEGGMGRVYLAHHKIIGKKVGVKILHGDLARDKEAVSRFVREARTASSIGNEHIVDISDFGDLPDGSTYFVMEYLDGDSLAERLESGGPMSAAVVCDLGMQLCNGLSAAHNQGIIHRDLKPDNIILVALGKRTDFCKILDFGIAKVSTSSSSTKLTMAGAVFGTPHYMSPEQAAGASVDHRTDIYSLGVILYEMTSGTLPFNADTFMGILTQHMYKAPTPIRSLEEAPECSLGLEAVIMKSLSKHPDGRYQTMDELATDLRTVLDNREPVAVRDIANPDTAKPWDYFEPTSPLTAPEPQGASPRRGPRLVAISGIVAAVAVVLFVLIKDSTTTAQPPDPRTVRSATATTAHEPAAEVAMTEVVLGSQPAGAFAHYEGRKVQLPSVILVPESETVKVRIVADGYQDKALELDGKDTRVVVDLEAIVKYTGDTPPTPTSTPSQNRVAPTTPPAPPVKFNTKPPPRTSEVVDPWAG